MQSMKNADKQEYVMISLPVPVIGICLIVLLQADLREFIQVAFSLKGDNPPGLRLSPLLGRTLNIPVFQQFPPKRGDVT